jgi:hypothetical protein
MPDKTTLLQVLRLSAGVAFVLAAMARIAFGWLWRTAPAAWRGLGGAVAVGVALFAGAWTLGLKPKWPPVEDQDRYLAVLLPATLVVASLAAFLDVRWWFGWLLRLLLALAVARILLHGTIYLEDSAGPGTRKWTPAQARLILGGLAVLLLAVWAALDVLARRTRGASAWVALAVASAGAAVAIMHSHYLTGGQLGVPLAGALIGAGASLLFRGSRETGSLGVGVVSLFGLLVIGRFIVELTTANALLLFLAPLLCWLPELPPVRRLWPVVRGSLAVVLVAVPVGFAVMQAEKQAKAEDAPAASPTEGTSQDYEQFGK